MEQDKAAWQQALAHYRAWNEAEFEEKVRNRGKKTPEQKWREYKALFAFGQRLRPQPSAAAQAQHAREWAEYYERIQQFEARRKARG